MTGDGCTKPNGQQPVGQGGEQWRPVVGFEGWYEVSSLGNVRRVAPATGSASRPGRVLRPGRDPGGRPMVHLHRPGQHTPRQVSWLVAEAFLGPRPAGHVVAHCNGDPADVRAVNLVYLTRRQVNARALAHLRKLTASQVAEIRAAAAQVPCPSVRALAARYGVSHQTISRIQRGEAYLDLGVEAKPAHQGDCTALLAGAPSRPCSPHPGIVHIASPSAVGTGPVAGCARVPLHPATLTPATAVAEQQRCRRHGCRQRWPAPAISTAAAAAQAEAGPVEGVAG